MNIKKLIKTFSLIALIAGLLRIGCSFAPYFHNAFISELLYISTDLLIIIGLIGVYLAQIDALGKIGFAGFIISLLGFSFIAGPETTFAGISVYGLGTPIIGVGLLLYSLAQLKTANNNKLIPLLMLLSIFIGGVGILFPKETIIFLVSGVLFGLAFSLNAWLIYKNS